MFKRSFIALLVTTCAMVLTGCPSEEVIVLDEFPSISLDEIWGDIVSFFTGGEATPFEVGDIIVGSDGGGFLRRVTAIDQDQGRITTETEWASLAEAVDDGSLSGEVTFLPEDFRRAKVPMVKADDIVINLNNITLYSKDGLTLSISHGSLSYAPHVVLNANFDDHRLTGFTALTEGDLILDLNLRLTASGGQNFSWETEIFNPIVKPFVFYIGPVPVAGTASLRIPFGVTANIGAAASAESGFDTTTHIRLGMQLNDGQWSNLSSFGDPVTNAHPLVITLSSSAGVTVYVRPGVGLNLYGVSDLSGYVQPYVQGDAQFIPSPLILDFYAGVNGGIRYELSIFDFTLYEKDWFFPGPRWPLYHYELPYDIPTTFTIELPL
ncbi:MAG TPA: hypothetical protein PLI09_02600 [Candidatus Hydrogenedentes bacterium]|nr:hypothetical protein [Candidatus Hydrogenedentota bacterium]